MPKKDLKKLIFIALIVTSPVFALKIITTSPQLTDIFFYLNKGSDIVATGGEYPKIPSIGPVFSLSIELLVSHKPDWIVVDINDVNRSFIATLKEHKYNILEVNIDTIKSFFDQTRKILKIIYHEENNILLDKLENCILKITPTKRFTYIAFVWLSPFVVFSNRTFFSKYMEKVGGINAIENYKMSDFPSLSHEWFFNKDVDVVFYFSDYPNASKKIKELTHYWWPNKKPLIIELNPDFFMRAGIAPFLDKSTNIIGEYNKRIWGCVEK